MLRASFAEVMSDCALGAFLAVGGWRTGELGIISGVLRFQTL